MCQLCYFIICQCLHWSARLINMMHFFWNTHAKKARNCFYIQSKKIAGLWSESTQDNSQMGQLLQYTLAAHLKRLKKLHKTINNNIPSQWLASSQTEKWYGWQGQLKVRVILSYIMKYTLCISLLQTITTDLSSRADEEWGLIFASPSLRSMQMAEKWYEWWCQ